jgi:hypothetical protein
VDNDGSNIEEIVHALLKLQALKIEREYDMVSDVILMTFSLEAMQEAMLKCDKEIERIKAETENQLNKYIRK